MGFTLSDIDNVVASMNVANRDALRAELVRQAEMIGLLDQSPRRSSAGTNTKEVRMDNDDTELTSFDQQEARAAEPMLKFFSYAHLPQPLAEVSRQFTFTARWMVDNLPRNPERTVALRKLLESKDCAVRAML